MFPVCIVILKAFLLQFFFSLSQTPLHCVSSSYLLFFLAGVCSPFWFLWIYYPNVSNWCLGLLILEWHHPFSVLWSSYEPEVVFIPFIAGEAVTDVWMIHTLLSKGLGLCKEMENVSLGKQHHIKDPKEDSHYRYYLFETSQNVCCFRKTTGEKLVRVGKRCLPRWSACHIPQGHTLHWQPFCNVVWHLE